MKRVTAVFFVLVLISGCSFSKVYTDAIEETEEHLNNEEFDQALESVEIALNEKEDDDVALNIESGLLKYQELKKQLKKRNWENVTDVINSFGTLDSVHPKLKKQVDEINKVMLEQVNLETQLSDGLEQVKSNLDNDSFEEADSLLVNFETNEAFKFGEAEVNSVREDYEQQFKAFKKENKKADRKKELKELSLKHEKKITKAEEKEAKMKQVKKDDESDKILQTLNETEAAYDEVLNDVYQSIIKEFPKEEDKLREVQREWLINYEKEIYEVHNNSGEYKAIEFSIQIKKKRTKELLNEYFK